MAITSFKGTLFSNFTPCHVMFDGESYPTVEHAYQAAKTLDKKERLRIKQAKTPGNAKYAGSQVTLRADWEAIKIDTMRKLLRQKFMKNDLYCDALRETGDQQLIEGNYWGDTFWGVCDGVGTNHLGRLLMEIRAELQP
jgi:ribA/ribD-fused uncharacterized protein